MSKPASPILKRLLGEPLSLFIIVSLGIFAFDAWRGEDETPAEPVAGPASIDRRIVINDFLVAALQEEFAWLEGREPTAEETQQLVSEWLDDEVVFREALARQMHMNDGKLREHLIEKVRLLWAETPDPPSDEQLLDYYLNNMDEYYAETKVSFDQIFYEQKPENPDSILQGLRAGEAVKGDRYWLGDNMNDYAESILKTSFGGNFYNSLLAAPTGEWVGPLSSPRGYHFVRVSAVQNPQPLPFDQLKERISRDWIASERFKRINAQLASVRTQFDVVMEADYGAADE